MTTDRTDSAYGTLRRELDAQPIMEYEEMALLYFRTDKLTFATSHLPPGTKSGYDPGHPGAHEVAYCAEGEVVLELGDEKQEAVRLTRGDAYLIGDGIPHTVYNAGREHAVVVWAAAPSLGRELTPLEPR